jgi:bifunctional DNase/RNase
MTELEEARARLVGVGDLRVVTMVRVAIELPSPHPEVVLREVASPYRELVIPIGLSDGVALSHGWRRIAPLRPLSHDVWAESLRRLGVTLEAVRIVDVEEGIFRAEMVLTSQAGSFALDCRPSDALNLAVRQDLSVPILVAESVLGVA